MRVRAPDGGRGAGGAPGRGGAARRRPSAAPRPRPATPRGAPALFGDFTKVREDRAFGGNEGK